MLRAGRYLGCADGSFDLDDYDPQGFYCEMLRSAASRVVRERLAGLSINALKEPAAAANAELYNLGITFTIYSDARTIDRILPFDVLPRVLSAEEWRHAGHGIVQGITALNLLLDDIYHDQQYRQSPAGDPLVSEQA